VATASDEVGAENASVVAEAGQGLEGFRDPYYGNGASAGVELRLILRLPTSLDSKVGFNDRTLFSTFEPSNLQLAYIARSRYSSLAPEMPLRLDEEGFVSNTLALFRTVSKVVVSKLVPLAAYFTLMFATQTSLHAQTFSVLYRFTGGSGNAAIPQAPLVRDAEGNLYGTSVAGGANFDGGPGTFFKLTPEGVLTILLSTSSYGSPFAPLTWDSKGDLFGVTSGTAYNGGAVFEIYPTGKIRTLYVFKSTASAYSSYAGLVTDALGNLYGTTWEGGAYYNNLANRGGTAFKMNSTGTVGVTVLHSFGSGSDGAEPTSGLIMDSVGNLYGTTPTGGLHGFGTVFKLTPSGTKTILHNFAGGTDGIFPSSGLTRDTKGNLYGTTGAGGGIGCPNIYPPDGGCGTVYKITPSGKEIVIYRFPGGSHGALPANGLVMDSGGNLYGTTTQGGGTGCGGLGCGTIFKITPTTTPIEHLLYSFRGGADGQSPTGVILDSHGDLYGATSYGGITDTNCSYYAIPGCGVVFKFAP